MPDLGLIAKGLLGPEPSGDPAAYPSSLPKMMSGGARGGDSGAYTFAGILAVLILGGYSLALTRSKGL